MKHRDSQKRIIEDDYIYFVTSKTNNNFPYFDEPILCDLCIEELRLCKQLKQFELYAFCLLPDHFHILFKLHKEFDISKVMHCFKRNFSRDANKIIEGEVPQPRRRIKPPYETVGEHMDARLHEWKIEFAKKYKHNHKMSKFQWKRSFHDHAIRDGSDFEHHFNYTQYNFDKHALPKD